MCTVVSPNCAHGWHTLAACTIIMFQLKNLPESVTEQLTFSPNYCVGLLCPRHA